MIRLSGMAVEAGRQGMAQNPQGLMIDLTYGARKRQVAG